MTSPTILYALDVIRRMLDKLRPPGLYELDLEPALRGLLAVGRRSDRMWRSRSNPPHDLSEIGEAVELTAFRVVQEAMTNIYRHSSARNAIVALRFDHSALPEDDIDAPLILWITISDDGVGIAPLQNKGRGLVGMSERVRALKGRLEIHERSDGGAVVDVALPLFSMLTSKGR